MIVGRELQELKLPHQLRPHPPALLHFRRSEPHTPSSGLGLWQIGKGALGDLQPFELSEQLLLPRCRSEPVASAGHVDQLVTLVVSKDQGVKASGAGRVPGDHKLLPLVHPYLLPGTRALAGLVPAIPALGYEPHLRSRNNKDFSTKYPAIVKALASMADQTVIDGEIVALDAAGRPSFNSTLQNYGSTGPLFYYVFDVMLVAGEDVIGLPLEARRQILRSQVLSKLADPISESPELGDSLQRLIQSVQAQGLEDLTGALEGNGAEAVQLQLIEQATRQLLCPTAKDLLPIVLRANHRPTLCRCLVGQCLRKRRLPCCPTDPGLGRRHIGAHSAAV